MKSLSTEKDLLLKIDKVFPWETFRDKLESLYSKKPKWDVTLLLKNQVRLRHLWVRGRN
jgi:hypothetical protein